MKTYAAVSSGKSYRVITVGPCGDFHVCGDVRHFDTFEEADQVARDISKGAYGYAKGEYISMR